MRTDRLRVLATFLDTLPPERFSFSKVRTETECGTVGCAMGWTPSVFPALVRVIPTQSRNSGIGCTPLLAPDAALRGIEDYVEVAVLLFEMRWWQAEALFTPGETGSDGQNPLEESATAKEVAKRIRKFADWGDAQEPS